MAMAVQRIHKGARCTIGPWIERGFYYDFDMPNPIADKDLAKIRKEMQKIIRKDLPFVKEEVSAAEARKRIEEINEPYKLEILDSIVAKYVLITPLQYNIVVVDNGIFNCCFSKSFSYRLYFYTKKHCRDASAPITIYHIGEPGSKEHWWDLCAGPHVPSTGAIDPAALDLESVAGAYWRGDETKAQLQRIYGTAWENAEQLEAYKHLKEEAQRRDHRRIGQDLDLFSINDAAGGGLVFWHPKGAMVRHVIEGYWKDAHLKVGFLFLLLL